MKQTTNAPGTAQVEEDDEVKQASNKNTKDGDTDVKKVTKKENDNEEGVATAGKDDGDKIDKQSSYPASKEKLGHYLGISHNVGDALTYKILTNNDQDQW